MGALRMKMIEEMKLRNFSPRTQKSYLSAMVGLVKYYRQPPDQLSQEQIRSYLLHLKERGLSPSSRTVAISGMKFLIDAQSADETVQTPINLDLYTNPRCTRLVVRQSRQSHEPNTLIAVLFEQRNLFFACPPANFS